MGESVDGEGVGSFGGGGDAEEGGGGGRSLRGERDFEKDAKEGEDVGVLGRAERGRVSRTSSKTRFKKQRNSPEKLPKISST